MVARIRDRYRLCCANVVRRVRSLSSHPQLTAIFDRHPTLKPAAFGFAWLALSLFFASWASELDREHSKLEALATLSVTPTEVRQVLGRFGFKPLPPTALPIELQSASNSLYIHESYDYAWIDQTPIGRVALSPLPEKGWHSVSLNWIDFHTVIQKLLELERKPQSKIAPKQNESDPRAIVY